MSELSITKKPAILGKSIKVSNVRSRPEEGDDEGDAGELVPAREISLTKIMLTEKQFNKLIGSDQAFNSFFDRGKKPAEPAFSRLPTQYIDETFKDCSATISFGVSDKTIEVEGGAKIKNIRVKPCVGGVAEMACTLVAPLPRAIAVLDLEDFFGKEITVSMKFGPVDEEEEAKEKQEDLDLEAKDDDESEDDDKPKAKGRKRSNGDAHPAH